MNFKTFDPDVDLDLSKLDPNDANKRKEIKKLLLELIKEGEGVLKKTERKMPSQPAPKPKLPVMKEIDMFKAPQPKPYPVIKEIDMFKAPPPKPYSVIKEIDMFKEPQRKLVLKGLKIERVRESSTSPQKIPRIEVQTKTATVVSADCKEIQQKLQSRGLKVEKTCVAKPTIVVSERSQTPQKPNIKVVKIETLSKFSPTPVKTTKSNGSHQNLSDAKYEEIKKRISSTIKTYQRKTVDLTLHKLQGCSVVINKKNNSNQPMIKMNKDPGYKCVICKTFFKNLILFGEHSKEDCNHRNIIFKHVEPTVEPIVPFEQIVIKSEFVEDPVPKVLKKIPFNENVKKLMNGEFLCLKCQFISNNKHQAFSHLMKHLTEPTQTKTVIPTPAPSTSKPIKKLPTIKSSPFNEIEIMPTAPPKFYQCDQCPKAFVSCILLSDHKQRMHKLKDDVESDEDGSTEADFHGFPEEFCDTIFDSVIDAMPKNMDVKLDEWLDKGSHSFIRPIRKIKKRVVRVKPLKEKLSKGIKHFHCIICKHGFAKQEELSNHILKHHESVPTFKCEICDKILLSQISLDTHKSLLHKMSNSKRYGCGKCENLYFAKQQLLDDHILFKHSFKCNQCDVRPFREKRFLENHVFKHHGGENCNKCHICGKLFKDFSAIKRHILAVHENYKPKTCIICGKNFKDIDMNRHMRTHTGERTFKCDSCDSTFRFDQDLVVHKRLHTGERPYECTICLMKFIANTNLNKHMKSRHPVAPDSLDKLLN